MKLKDRIVIVTGGSGIIGKAIIKEFVKEGAIIVLTYFKNNKEVDNILDKLNLNEQKVFAFKCDIKKIDDIQNVVNFCIERFGKIDILINNAGVGYKIPINDTTEEIWNETIDINLKGSFYFIKTVVPYMIKERYGKIINIASIAGLIGIEGFSAYSASKSGLIGLTKNLALELGRYNINVNAIAPGTIRTPERDRMMDEVINAMKASSLGRIGEPEEVAKAAVFLVSSDSDFITGQTLIVDGGRVIKSN